MRLWKIKICILISMASMLFCGCSPFITEAFTAENYWLEELQHNKSPHMRKNAAVTLGHLGSSKSVEPLIKALRDENEDVRIAAAESLGKIGDANAIPFIKKLLYSKDRHAGRTAAKALEELDWKPEEASDSVHLAVLSGDWEKCVEIGSPAVGLIIELLEHDVNSFEKQQAAKTLGQIGDRRAIKPLEKLLADDDWRVKLSAVESLVSLGWYPENANERLIYYVWKRQWDNIVAIGPSAVEPLIKLTSYRDPAIRRGAIISLGKIGDDRAVTPLMFVLGNNLSNERGEAAEALGKIGNPQCRMALLAALDDWQTGPIVARVLVRMGWQPIAVKDQIHLLVAQRKGTRLREKWPETKRVLLDDVKRGDYSRKENALYAFMGIGNEEVIPQLIDILDDDHPRITSSAFVYDGAKTIAEAFLNCGHEELDKAARSWAAQHGYTIHEGQGAAPVAWGSWW